ncbi:fungal-specific transcription factor domain-containing protein [Mycena crocata]|nr:fungal-specific transcription factor domain-containing protein [Mycena crocata]
MKTEHDGLKPQQPSSTRRPEFWHSPWEKQSPSPLPVYTFPPKDLMDALISLFFERLNILMAVLHRPTFERSIASGLHLTDPSFGGVVLAVCALASRFSDDPRVVFDGTDTMLSAGWEWFRQIQHLAPNFYLRPTLYDLQRIFLMIIYLQGTCSPEACWTLTSIGVRILQELGVHVRKRHNQTALTVEDELYKRVFWMLVTSDAMISAILGRPRSITDDDYDTDYPAEVDDNYWDNPDPQKRFQQPPGKPSVMAFMTAYLKLTEILGMAQKTIYSVKRSYRSTEWGQTIVAELDSSLNEWLDGIPNHLRWDPNREDGTFATQSACLYAAYYHVQIQIHRSFIPSPTNDAPLSSTFPSLAICANAARSLSHVMEAQTKRGLGLIGHPQAVSVLMDSAVVLLLNVWGARRTGTFADPQRAAHDVQKCIAVLKMYERRWQIAGRYCDMLFTIGNELINTTQVPSTLPLTLKRSRDEPTVPTSVPLEAPEPRAIAGSRRVSVAINQQGRGLDPPDLSHLYALPISTEELGHLPVYQSFDWGIPFGNDDDGLAFNLSPTVQYNSNPDFTMASAPSQYTQLNAFTNHNTEDWATRDWTTYIDSVDQLMQTLDSGR